MVTKEDTESRLTAHDRLRLFESLGVRIERRRPNEHGWINGLRRPAALGPDDKPSFGVNIETGAVNDFGSDYANDLWGFVQDVRRCTFPDALRYVAEQVGLHEPKPKPKRTVSALNPVSLDEARSWNERLLTGAGRAAAFLHYLTEHRGLISETIENRGLGLRDCRGAAWFFIPLEIGDEVSRYKMIAVDTDGSGWRLTAGKKNILTCGPTGLYLLDQPFDLGAPLLLCEGEIDALLARQEGFNAITATGGAGTFKPAWAQQIASHAVSAAGVVVAYDGDQTGRSGAEKAASTLSKAGVAARVATLPEGQDVSDVIRGQGPDALRQLIATAQPFATDSKRSEIVSPVGVVVADVQRETVSWLWRGRLALGKLSILDGDPGTGKSTLYCDLAARITMGGTWPDGTPCTKPGGVVIVTTEDGIADTIRPRLEEAGTDLSRVVVVQMIGDRVPEIPRDLDALRGAIEPINARLLVIDPLMAHLPSDKNSHVDQHMRLVLAPVATFAEETGIAVLVVRHWTKTEGRKAIYRGGGTIGIIGAARIGLMLTKDPDDKDRRILAGTKNNLGPIAGSLLLRLVSSNHDPGTAVIQWEGESSYTAEDLSGYDSGHTESAAEEAEVFLVGLLAAGPVDSATVEKERLRAGIAEATLNRAKKRMKVRSRRLSRDDGTPFWTWEMPTCPRSIPTQGPDRPSIHGPERGKIIRRNIDNLDNLDNLG